MSTRHVVHDGEHLARIAEEHGFHKLAKIWDHPENAALRARRGTPHQLLPGDEVFIPDLAPLVATGLTNRVNTFVVQRLHLTLRVAALRLDSAPVAGAVGTMEHEGKSVAVQTDDRGRCEIDIPARTERALLTLGDLCIEVAIGALHPFDEPSGAEQRLINLGYFPGPPGDADELDLRVAVEEFECDQGLPLTGVLSPEILEALRQAHGC